MVFLRLQRYSTLKVQSEGKSLDTEKKRQITCWSNFIDGRITDVGICNIFNLPNVFVHIVCIIIHRYKRS